MSGQVLMKERWKTAAFNELDWLTSIVTSDQEEPEKKV